MTVFISGGAKNGKSSLAQSTAVALSGDGRRYYLATMIPADEEDRERIRRHVADRAGLGFETVERGRQLAGGPLDSEGTYLLDSVTALLTNELFPPERDYAPDPSAAERVGADLLALIERVKNVVFVSDYIYADAETYGEMTELYRRSLAALDRLLAARCDTVVEVSAGRKILYKGELPI